MSKDKDFQGLKEYIAQARRVFAGEISEEKLAQAFLENIDIPERVGGHDSHRNREEGTGQKGRGQSADDHSIAQGTRWLGFTSKLSKSPHKIQAAKAFFKEYQKPQLDPEELSDSFVSSFASASFSSRGRPSSAGSSSPSSAGSSSPSSAGRSSPASSKSSPEITDDLVKQHAKAKKEQQDRRAAEKHAEWEKKQRAIHSPATFVEKVNAKSSSPQKHTR